MSLEQKIDNVVTATENLLDAVNIKKATLDATVATVADYLDQTQVLYTNIQTGASETNKGIIQLATQAEVTSGTGSDTAVSPEYLKTELDKKSNSNHTHSMATEALDGFMSKEDKVKLNGIETSAQVNTITSVAGKVGDVTLTKSDVGLSNVDNTSDINKPISTDTQTALNLKADIDSPTFTGVVSGITKDMVGLSNIDNTSDLLKPISTDTQNALNLKADIANPTFTGKVTTAASVVGSSGLNIPPGVAPTAPVSGDIWTTPEGVFARIGSTTQTLVHTGTWTVPTQAEAEAGSATTTRLWTAQRIRQNVMAAPVATPTVNGLMSAADKARLDNIDVGGGGDGGLPDAPVDGKLYGRQDAVWTEVPDVAQATESIAGISRFATEQEVDDAVLDNVSVSPANLEHKLSKFSQVDNTSDADKPISTATQAALALKAPTSHVGATGSAHGLATTSVAGFMSSADKLKLDSVASNAGVTSVAGKTGVVTLDKGDVGLSNVDNTSDTNKPISTAVQSALDLKAPSDHVGATGNAHGVATTSIAGFMSAADKVIVDGIATGVSLPNEAGGVGTYAFVSGNSTTSSRVTWGNTKAGNTLVVASLDGHLNILTGASLTGTWRVMSAGIKSDSTDDYEFGVAVRIA